MAMYLSNYGNVFIQIWHCVYQNMAMYLSKYGSVFIKIWQCIYPNMAMYLSKYGNVFIKFVNASAKLVILIYKTTTMAVYQQ